MTSGLAHVQRKDVAACMYSKLVCLLPFRRWQSRDYIWVYYALGESTVKAIRHGIRLNRSRLMRPHSIQIVEPDHMPIGYWHATSRYRHHG